MQQPGGSPFGVPPSDMSPFSSPPFTAAAAAPRSHLLTTDPLQPSPEAASPINSRPPAAGGSSATTPHLTPGGFDELAPGVAANFGDDDAAALAAAAAAGEEAERGGTTGNRWPRQETLVLLKIRSEMDAAFRDATLKGPLWDEVSRKLAELGYKRSAKKCKEKFENVHKYYKRTKEGRAGRQDGKSYRFFSQLEALHSGAGATSAAVQPPPAAAAAPAPLAAASATPISFSAPMTSGRIQHPSPISAAPPPSIISTPARLMPELTPFNPKGVPSLSGDAVNLAGGISFSSNSSSSASLSDSDDEATEEAGGSHEGRKRKRGGGGGNGGSSSSSRKMMAFFEGLMKQVMERQEAMQQRFLETIEKREQDRMIREEAWRRQEMTRLTREQELFAQERAMAASRDATLLSYIQKLTGHTVQLPPMSVGAISVTTTTIPPQPQTHASAPAPPQPQPLQQQQQQPAPPQLQKPPIPVQPLQQQPPPPPPPPQQRHQQEIQLHPKSTDIVLRHQPPTGTEMLVVPEGQDIGGSTIGFEPLSASSSRWPKAEVHALIKLRSGLDSRYQEAGPKGPLWEEISAGMQRLGYNRSAKRCKEKWENINKYFKKVKESNKKRPEDAKTCPYFHQLDALYRKKQLSASGSSSAAATGIQQQQQQHLVQELTEYSDLNPQERTEVPLIVAAAAAAAATQQPAQAQQQPPAEAAAEKNGNNSSSNGNSSRNGGNPEGGGGIQIQTSNGGLTPSFFEEGSKKPEDIVKELMGQRHSQQAAMMDDYDKMEEADSDDMDHDEDDDDDDDGDDDDDDDDEEEDNDNRKMQYKIQFQRQNVGGGSGSGNSGSGGGNNTSTTTAAAATTAAGSFMAMVK